MKKKIFRERRYGEVSTKETKRTKKNITKKGKKND